MYRPSVCRFEKCKVVQIGKTPPFAQVGPNFKDTEVAISHPKNGTIDSLFLAIDVATPSKFPDGFAINCGIEGQDVRIQSEPFYMKVDINCSDTRMYKTKFNVPPEEIYDMRDGVDNITSKTHLLNQWI